jgi:hypothetical protein
MQFGWENIDKACNSFACHKNQMRVFTITMHTIILKNIVLVWQKNKQLVVSRKDDNIDPYSTRDLNVKYLTCTDQMHKFKPTEYYIVYYFETMENPLDYKNKDSFIAKEDGDNSSSSLSKSSSSSSPTQSTSKISNIYFSALYSMSVKTKSGMKTAYLDRRDDYDFIIKLLQSLVEVAEK